MSDLTDLIRKKCEFDYSNLNDFAIDREAKAEHERLMPIIEALIECVDCLDELAEILNDREARRQIDSLTAQPSNRALGKLREAIK